MTTPETRCVNCGKTQGQHFGLYGVYCDYCDAAWQGSTAARQFRVRPAPPTTGEAARDETLIRGYWASHPAATPGAARCECGPTTSDAPRRIRIDLFTPAERAIYDAVQEVEKAGAHPLLTDAVVLLQQAREKVADYVDHARPTETL